MLIACVMSLYLMLVITTASTFAFPKTKLVYSNISTVWSYSGSLGGQSTGGLTSIVVDPITSDMYLMALTPTALYRVAPTGYNTTDGSASYQGGVAVLILKFANPYTSPYSQQLVLDSAATTSTYLRMYATAHLDDVYQISGPRTNLTVRNVMAVYHAATIGISPDSATLYVTEHASYVHRIDSLQSSTPG